MYGCMDVWMYGCMDVHMCVQMCMLCSAQNKGWKLVGHSLKVRTFLQTNIPSPIGIVQ